MYYKIPYKCTEPKFIVYNFCTAHMDCDMEVERELPQFENFVSHVITLQKHLKISIHYNFSKSRASFDTCVTTILLVLNFFLLLSEFLDIKNATDLPSFAARINPVAFHFFGFVKWTYCIICYKEIGRIFDTMDYCHKLCQKLDKSDRGKHRYKLKMMDCQKQSIKFVTLWMIVCVYGVLQWCLNPVIYDIFEDLYGIKDINATAFTRHLPYPGWFPWKIDSFPIYCGCFAFQFVGAFGSGIGIGIFDVFYISIIMYICVYLEYLSEVLLEDAENNINFSEKVMKERSFKEKLEICIVHHSAVLEVFEKMENFTYCPMFVQCAETIIALCLVSLEASTAEINSSIESVMKLSSLVEYWTGITVESFFYCYFATKIRELGLKVGDAFYHCHWEEFMCEDKPSQQKRQVAKLITFGILRAQKPMEVAGGPFYVLSLETFKAMTGMSISNALILGELSGEH